MKLKLNGKYLECKNWICDSWNDDKIYVLYIPRYLVLTMDM